MNKIQTSLKEKTLDDYYMIISKNRNDDESMQIIKNIINDKTFTIDEYIYYLSFIMNNEDRQVSIVTKVEDGVYDLLNKRMMDLKRRMILCFDKLTTQIDSSKITINDDGIEINYSEYLNKAILYNQMFDSQCDSIDITDKFLNNNSKTLKK